MASKKRPKPVPKLVDPETGQQYFDFAAGLMRARAEKAKYEGDDRLARWARRRWWNDAPTRRKE